MVTVFAVYLAAHLAVYFVWLRRTALLRTEKGIFLYHLGSAFITGLSALAAAIIDPTQFGLAGFVLILSTHGIYSLTFLELWSLAQGGYSLSIIAGILRAEATGTAPDFSGLAAIGAAKQVERLAALKRMGLVSNNGELISLTTRGSVIAAALHALRRWVDPGDKRASY